MADGTPKHSTPSLPADDSSKPIDSTAMGPEFGTVKVNFPTSKGGNANKGDGVNTPQS